MEKLANFFFFVGDVSELIMKCDLNKYVETIAL